MTTQMLVKKLNKEVTILRKDMYHVKKFLFSSTQDPEGEYRKSFVKKILDRAHKKGQIYQFVNKSEFLRNVRSSE